MLFPYPRSKISWQSYSVRDSILLFSHKCFSLLNWASSSSVILDHTLFFSNAKVSLLLPTLFNHFTFCSVNAHLECIRFKYVLCLLLDSSQASDWIAELKAIKILGLAAHQHYWVGYLCFWPLYLAWIIDYWQLPWSRPIFPGFDYGLWSLTRNVCNILEFSSIFHTEDLENIVMCFPLHHINNSLSHN